MHRLRLALFLAVILISLNALASNAVAEELQSDANSRELDNALRNGSSTNNEASKQLDIVLQEAQSAVRLEQMGDHLNAERMREQAIGSLQSLAKMGRFHFAVGAQSCARAFAVAGKYEEARTLLSEAWHRIEDNPNHHAAVLRHRLLHTAGSINIAEEKFLDAKQHLDFAAKIAWKVFGKDSVDYGDTLSLLGYAEMRLDETNDALAHLTEAEQILSEKLGVNDYATISTKICKVDVLCIQGDYDSAKSILVKALAELDTTSANSKSCLHCRIKLAKVHVDQGELQSAEQILIKAIEDSNSPDLQEEWTVAQGTLAKVYRLKGDLDRGKTAFDSALRVAREREPLGLDTAALLHEGALLAAARNDMITARNYVNEAIEIASAKLSPSHRLVLKYSNTKESFSTM